MATVRITGTTKEDIHHRKWLGAPAIDPHGHIDRSIDLPDAFFEGIEGGIVKGYVEGTLYLDDGRRLDWFLDRGAPSSSPAGGTALSGAGDGI